MTSVASVNNENEITLQSEKEPLEEIKNDDLEEEVIKYEYQKKYTFDERLEEASNILKKYPNRVPIIVEKFSEDDDLEDLDKHKYLVPMDISMGKFMYVIRNKINLKPEIALFFHVNETMLSATSLISEIYEKHKHSDNFLYCSFSKERVFG